jgi:hypothetical protein
MVINSIARPHLDGAAKLGIGGQLCGAFATSAAASAICTFPVCHHKDTFGKWPRTT